MATMVTPDAADDVHESRLRSYSYSKDEEVRSRNNSTFLSDLFGIEQLKQTVSREYQILKFEIKESWVGNRAYHIAWAVYVISMSLIGGAILHRLGDNNFLNNWFDAASCTANSGLSAVAITDRSRSEIATLAMLMLCGSGAVLLLPTLIYRCYILHKLLPDMKNSLNRAYLSRSTKKVIRDHILLYQGSWLMIWIIVLYLLLFLVGGALLLYACLTTEEMEPHLQESGFTHFQNAMFITVSAFTNSGSMIYSEFSIELIGHN
jgi:Trk-type K+ transport system membrane component